MRVERLIRAARRELIREGRTDRELATFDREIRQLGVLPATGRCPRGHRLPDGAQYCPRDGGRISTAGAALEPLPEAPDELHCMACLAEMDPAWQFCIYCGLPAGPTRSRPRSEWS